MTRTITCKEAERDCTWSFNAESMEEAWSKLKDHIESQHKDIELTPENIDIIKSIITLLVKKSLIIMGHMGLIVLR